MHLDNNNVEFIDKSLGSFTNIHWSLGNGEHRTNTNFAFEYPNFRSLLGVFSCNGYLIWLPRPNL